MKQINQVESKSDFHGKCVEFIDSRRLQVIENRILFRQNDYRSEIRKFY